MQVINKGLTLPQLRQIPLVRPKRAGATWGGVRHAAYVDHILEEFEDRGYDVDDMWFYTTHHHMNLVGTFRVRVAGGPIKNAGLMLAVTVGNDRKHRGRYYAGLAGGRRWAMVTGGYVVPTLRTHISDIPAEVGAAVGWWATAAGEVRRRIKHTAQMPLSAPAAYRMMVMATRGSRDPLLPASRVPVADQAYTEMVAHPGTAYALLRAYGVAAMAGPPMLRYGNMLRFYEMVTRGRVAA